MENSIHQTKKSISFFTGDYAIIFYITFFKILLHLINPEYGYHRDELFFLYISDHLRVSNLDMLPLTPLYLKCITTLFGTSLKAIHFASALPGALSIFLTCIMTRTLGGGKFAIVVTGLSTLFSGCLTFGGIFTYDSLDFLTAVTALYFLILLFKTDKPVYWIPVGIALGLGVLNKLTSLFFCLSIVGMLLLVPQRRYFKDKWIWVAGAIVLISLLPFILWQFFNDWYFIHWAGSYAGGTSYIASLPEYIWNQFLPNNPVNFPIWFTGLTLLLFSKKWKFYRFFGLNYLFLFVLFFLISGKFYFLTPYYTVLLAVGSIKIESLITSLKRPLQSNFHYALPVVYVLLSLVIVPIMIPVLPVKLFIKYTKVLGMGADAGVKYENQQLNELPQHFADRFGWEELAKKISELTNELPDSEKANLGGIVCGNYGQASAINFYRDRYGLPEAISAHGWYFFHTKQTHSFKSVYISLLDDSPDIKTVFQQVDSIGLFTHPYCILHETNRTIYLYRKPLTDLRVVWETMKQ